MKSNSADAIIKELVGALQTSLDNYAPSSLNVAPPTLHTATSINQMLGTNLNRSKASIYNELANIINTAYDTALTDQGNNERAFIQALANVADSAQDTMRNQYGEAAAAGANRGMYAADVLSAILGMQNTSMEGVNTLFGNRSALLNQRANDLAGAANEAQNTYNALQQYLADYAKSIYETDSTNHTTELASWNAYIDAIMGALPSYLAEYAAQGGAISTDGGVGNGASELPQFSSIYLGIPGVNTKVDKMRDLLFGNDKQPPKVDNSALEIAIKNATDKTKQAVQHVANAHGGGSLRRGTQAPMLTGAQASILKAGEALKNGGANTTQVALGGVKGTSPTSKPTLPKQNNTMLAQTQMPKATVTKAPTTLPSVGPTYTPLGVMSTVAKAAPVASVLLTTALAKMLGNKAANSTTSTPPTTTNTTSKKPLPKKSTGTASMVTLK